MQGAKPRKWLVYIDGKPIATPESILGQFIIIASTHGTTVSMRRGGLP